jgi:hypothetical protein
MVSLLMMVSLPITVSLLSLSLMVPLNDPLNDPLVELRTKADPRGSLSDILGAMLGCRAMTVCPAALSLYAAPAVAASDVAAAVPACVCCACVRTPPLPALPPAASSVTPLPLPSSPPPPSRVVVAAPVVVAPVVVAPVVVAPASIGCAAASNFIFSLCPFLSSPPACPGGAADSSPAAAASMPNSISVTIVSCFVVCCFAAPSSMLSSTAVTALSLGLVVGASAAAAFTACSVPPACLGVGVSLVSAADDVDWVATAATAVAGAVAGAPAGVVALATGGTDGAFFAADFFVGTIILSAAGRAAPSSCVCSSHHASTMSIWIA